MENLLDRPNFINLAKLPLPFLRRYDCSSGDLNPIGAISKGDLKKMLSWVGKTYGWDVLAEVAAAPPTAELRPNAASEELEHSQLDEDEMGMSYEELGVYGKLRKVARCGPVSMFQQLCHMWTHLSPAAVAEKVKHFWIHYSRNRHKVRQLVSMKTPQPLKLTPLSFSRTDQHPKDVYHHSILSCRRILA